MYPQTFLRTFWQLELRPQVFVAMSFAPQYTDRFDKVIAPAISDITVENCVLSPKRVDISKNGDSILTEISDGIAHSRLILADVSSIGKDSVTGQPYRNANVLYEVGLALACRHSSEVLLVRDDEDKFLFDVSTIPHRKIDFTDTETARKVLTEELLGRLREQKYQLDARIRIAIDSLSAEEIVLLKQMNKYDATTVWGREVMGIASWYSLATQRLLDKRIIRLAGEFEGDRPAFRFTSLGFVVHQLVNHHLTQYKDHKPETTISDDTDSLLESGGG